jgi:hypothetical protein
LLDPYCSPNANNFQFAAVDEVPNRLWTQFNASANSFTLYILWFSMRYPLQLCRLSHRAVSKATRSKKRYGTAPVTFSGVEMQCEPATADFNLRSGESCQKFASNEKWHPEMWVPNLL